MSDKVMEDIFKKLAERRAGKPIEVIPIEITEEKKETESDIISEQEKYKCGCIECGYKMESSSHCKDLKCPKCGGQMRREERPGVGQEDLNIENEDGLEEELGDEISIFYCPKCNEIFTVKGEEFLENCPACKSEEILEKIKLIIRQGQLIKKKVIRKKHHVLSAAQKSGLKKAQRKAHTGTAQRAREKSMKIRKRKVHDALSLDIQKDMKEILDILEVPEKIFIAFDNKEWDEVIDNLKESYNIDFDEYLKGLNK